MHLGNRTIQWPYLTLFWPKGTGHVRGPKALARLFAQAEMSLWFQGQKEATVAAAAAPAGESTNYR